jgi:GNAT superfamily N-acetyltransferase
MELKSLGLRTELMLRSFESHVEVRPSYIVVRTPQNPTYRWGNYVIFQAPPKPGDLQRWKQIFHDELGPLNHFVFAWDQVNGVQGAAQEFLEAGFWLEQTVVQTAQKVHPPRTLNTHCQCRAFLSDADWAQWLELALIQNAALPTEEREGEGYEIFLRRKAAEYRRMIAAGWGNWFGAFVGGQLAASMGLFVKDGLGRFQSVDTHPDFRRQGLAGTLLYHVARYGFGELGAKDLVILADLHYFAKDLYASVGFRPTEHLVALEWTLA